MKRGLKDYALLALKGMSMGAADVVPGVSGGTIAFIVGIYDELIDSIKSINAQSLKMFFTGRWRAFWKMINGNFLFFLLAGIGISVFSLAKVITWLLTDHPILVWSFFFGLVLASTWFVGKDIKEWNWKTILGFIVYYSCNTRRNSVELIVYLFVWSYCYLCNDSSGYIW